MKSQWISRNLACPLVLSLGRDLSVPWDDLSSLLTPTQTD